MATIIEGERALKRALEALPDRIYRKVVRQVTSKMASPIVTATRRNVRAMTSAQSRGVLAKNISKKTKTYKKDGAVVTVIGGKKPGGYHFHLVEFGHRMVVGGTAHGVRNIPGGWTRRLAGKSKRTGTRGGGRVVGFVPGRPMLRQAFVANKLKAMGIATTALKTGIEREAKKLAAVK